MTVKHTTLTLFTIISFTVILCVTALLYWPGLNSPFIFDDIPNLSPIGKHGDLGVFRDMALFILQGDSGPTGRPISLASFYLDDISWQGASPEDFKYTNLMLHLLNGVLVFWVTTKLTAYTALAQTKQSYIALAATALWVLHPMQINTVLYVVQRMTELSALFTLTGIICYLYGRESLNYSQKKAWVLLLGGGGLSLLLALFSKENGILLVVYILAIEYLLIRPFSWGATQPKNLNKGLIVAAWLPFILLNIYLLRLFTIPNVYASRPFDLTERLLTEARIVWDYLSNILLPDINDSSLFHDDYVASTGWLEPITTLPAVIGIILLFSLIFILRNRQPIIAFAIAWFLGGHLLESTTVPLELYFEHRNYLPLYGPVFAVAYYLLTLGHQLPKLRLVLPFVLSAYLSLVLLISYQGIQLWTDPVQMIVKWTQNHPKSQRTLEALDAVIGEHISPDTRQKLQNDILKISQENNTSSYLLLRDVLSKCKTETLENDELNSTIKTLRTAGFTAATAQAYVDITTQWMDNKCGTISADQLIKFTENIRSIKSLQHRKLPFLLHYWQAEIQVTQGNLDQVMLHHEAAYNIKPSIDSLLLQMHYLNSAGLYAESIKKLEQAKKGLCTDTRKCLMLKIRQPELDTFMQLLKKRLEEQKESDKYEKIVHNSTGQE